MNTILLDIQLLLGTTSSFNSSALPPFQKFLCYLHRICIYPLESLLKTINSKLLLNMPYLAPQSLHTKLIKTFCLTQGRGIIIIFLELSQGFYGVEDFGESHGFLVHQRSPTEYSGMGGRAK